VSTNVRRRDFVDVHGPRCYGFWVSLCRWSVYVCFCLLRASP
jgi:hypothetical protein